jgi:phage shock protein A
LKSNLNALVDRAEDPDKLIGQTIVEMETEVKKARRELVTALGSAKRLEKKHTEHLEEVDEWERKAVLALREGDEDLAREALRRKLKAEQAAAQALAQARAQASAADEMKSTLDAVELKIDDLKAKRGTLAAQVRRAREAPPAAGSTGGRFGSPTFDELERMTGRIDQLEAEVEAASVLEDPSRADVDARFRELEKRSGRGAVDDQLAALKKKLGG